MCQKNYLNKGFTFFTPRPITTHYFQKLNVWQNCSLCPTIQKLPRCLYDATGVSTGIMFITNFVKICQLVLNLNLEQRPQSGDLLSQLSIFKE
jgi:hypothetical protein